MEKQKEPVPVSMIAKALNDRRDKVSHKINLLLKTGEIKFIEIKDTKETMERFNCKHRIRLYFIEK